MFEFVVFVALYNDFKIVLEATIPTIASIGVIIKRTNALIVFDITPLISAGLFVFPDSNAVFITANIAKNKIKTTGELAELIVNATPKIKSAIHPATRVFQAIRIEVNGELDGLDNVLTDIIDSLKLGGRFCVLTFHSLEDRIVKNAFKDLETDCVCDKSLPVCVCGKKREIITIGRKPLVATEDEQKNNSRSKCAKLRIAEKI